MKRHWLALCVIAAFLIPVIGFGGAADFSDPWMVYPGPEIRPESDAYSLRVSDTIFGGPVTDVRYYSSFSAAITSIGATETTLLIPNSQTVSTDVTVPTTMELMFTRNGSLSIDTGKTVTLNTASINAGSHQIFSGSGTATFGTNNIPTINPSWYGDISTDIGLVLNDIMTANPTGVEIKLPKGIFTAATQIDLDIMDRTSAIKIIGAGTTNQLSQSRGTVIDGTGMTDDIIVGAQTKANDHIILKDFTVLPGTADGIVMGTSAYSVTLSEFVNLTVRGGDGWGMKFYNGYASYLNQLYVINSGDGIYLETMNASRIGILTVRTVLGTTAPYALTIVGGRGWSIGALYIESNAKGALDLGNYVFGLTIDSIYMENNNTGGAAVYEVLIGDDSVNAATSRNITINNMFSTNSNDYSGALVGIDKMRHLDLSFNLNWIPAVALKLISNAVTNTPLTLRNVVAPSSTIDLSNAKNTGSNGTILLEGGNLVASTFEMPSTVQVHTIGGNNLRLSTLYDRTITASGTTTVTVNNRNIYADATSGAQTITIPTPANARGMDFTVTKIDATANTVTIAGTTYAVRGKSVLTKQWDSATYRYDFTANKLVNISTSDHIAAEATFTSGDATPSVSGGSQFVFHADTSTVTGFDDGVAGQIITIRAVNALSDITDGGNLKLAGDFTGDADDTIKLYTPDGTTWYEISRSAN